MICFDPSEGEYFGGQVEALKDVYDIMAQFFSSEGIGKHSPNIIALVDSCSPAMLIFITDVVTNQQYEELDSLKIPHMTLLVRDSYNIYKDVPNGVIAVTPDNISAVLGGELNA